MNNRVRQLDLRLSLPPELRSKSWKLAEQLRDGFVCEVVERIAERFHAQYGADAIIEIPLLELKWDGEAQVAADFDYARKLGDEVAEELLDGLGQQSIEVAVAAPTSRGAIKVYRNRAHKSAVNISVLAEQQQQAATLSNQAAIEQEWRSVCERGSGSVAATVQYICEMQTHDVIAESLSTELIEAAVAVYPLSGWQEPMRAIIGQRLLQAPLGVPEIREDIERRPPNGAAPKADGAGYVDVEKVGDVTGVVGRGVEKTTENNVERQESAQPGGESATLPEKLVAPVARQENSPTPRTTKLEPDVRQAGTTDADVPSPPASPSPGETQRSIDTEAYPGADERVTALPDGEETHYAGLVYMLNLIMRIELPEILWCCGIDERTFFFDLCRELAGADGQTDPVLSAISGIQPDRSNYAATAAPGWACEEVIRKVHARLQRLQPEAAVDKQYSPTDADVDTRVDASDHSWQLLIGVVARLLSAAFLDLVRSADALDAYLSLSGWISMSTEETVIRLPMESIDIDVRRAALDVNPGYLQWCRYTMRLEFVEDSAE